MKFFRIFISKLLIRILNYTSPKKTFYSSNIEENDNILIEQYNGFNLFTEKKIVEREFEIIDFFKYVFEDIDKNSCFLMLGNYTSVEVIQNINFFSGKIYIVEFSKFQYDLQFLTNNLFDSLTKSRLILFNYDLNINNTLKLADFIYDFDKISFIRINKIETFRYILHEGDKILLNKPIIFLEKVSIKQFIDFNIISLLKYFGYYICTIQVNNSSSFIKMDNLNLNYLKQENINKTFEYVNFLIFTNENFNLSNYIIEL